MYAPLATKMPQPHHLYATAASCVSFVAVILWVLLREMKLFTPLSYAREPSDVAGISGNAQRKIAEIYYLKIYYNTYVLCHKEKNFL